MSDIPTSQPSTATGDPPPRKKRRWFWRTLKYLTLTLVVLIIVGRLTMSYFVRQYVNRVLNQSHSFNGHISDIQIHLWRGAYEIDNLRIVKNTGDVPVPLIATKKLTLEVEWKALLHRKLVGRVVMSQPELNFVEAPSDADSQSGAGGPWLEILRDLFPFKINSAEIQDGSVHFRTFRDQKPVDVYLSQLDGSIDNLTNVRDELTPLMANVSVDGLAMDQAKFELRAKLNPTSYHPSFQLAVRLLGLEVTKINDLTLTYGKFDFKKGLFDFVLQANARYGYVDGYALPLFRNLQVFDLSDLQSDDPLHGFWQALVGVTTEVLKNQQRNQFGTRIPFTANIDNPNVDVLTATGNILRNAFIRAYLPRFNNGSTEVDNMHFEPPKITDSISVGDDNTGS